MYILYTRVVCFKKLLFFKKLPGNTVIQAFSQVFILIDFLVYKKEDEFRYLFHTMKISSYANTTALPSINGKDLSEIEINIPLLQEQTRIAQILSDIDAEIEALEKKLEKYKMLKQGMMQELLTGKTRFV